MELIPSRSVSMMELTAVLAMFGVLHLVLAWGLFEREPWARVLGVYTLWVLLPESSSREYNQLSQPSSQMNGARAPS